MSRLSNDHRRLIVQRLATFVAHSEIAAELRGEGVAVSLSQIAYYDPGSAGTDMAVAWRELFDETRRAFVAQLNDQAITHRSWRLRELEDAARAAKKSRNYKLMADLLEQAAKEIGGMYDASKGASERPTPEEQAYRIRTAIAEMDIATAVPTAPMLRIVGKED